jgi:hypothetical protein
LGYSDTQIQKIAHWKGATFKEYIQEELACCSAGMTRDMKRNFKFVNIAGNAYHDVTSACIEEDYNLNCAAAAQVQGTATMYMCPIVGMILGSVLLG